VFLFLFSCNNKNINQEDKNEEINWASTIATIIYKNCTPCHRPGESGMFNLLSYSDVKRNAAKIKFAVRSGFMPPWPADPAYTHFIGERILLPDEKNNVIEWLESGMPRGDSLNEPVAPEFFNGSFFGKPDLVVKLKEGVFLKGNGSDHFFMIKYPFEIPEEKYVRYVEYVPNKRKLVHHVNGHLVSYEESKKTGNVFDGKQVVQDVQENFKTFYMQMNLLNDDGSYPRLTPNVVYYLPGYTPPVYPNEIGGFTLKKKGAFFLKNIHYGPTPVDQIDSSYINVFYTDKPPKRPIAETQIGTFGVSPVEPKLIVPPNTIKTFSAKQFIAADISVLSVNPHMHLIGKSFLAYALTPQNDTIRLVKIPKWDFRWQYYYTFEKPIKIPAGSYIYAWGTYDNTDANPFNPFSPPREIAQGEGNESMQTTEEMFQFIYTYIPYQRGDEFISLKPDKK
jgi:hypothetical protein